LAVHLDVVVLDFTDALLAEDIGGRNTGPTLTAVAPDGWGWLNGDHHGAVPGRCIGGS